MDDMLYSLVLGGDGYARSEADRANARIDSLPKGLVYKGAVNYYSNLPTSGVTVGDCYTVRYKGTSGTVADGTEYAWGPVENINQWVPLGADISGKADKDTDATAGHLAQFDAEGNPVDSGRVYPTVSASQTTLIINV